MNYRWRPLIDDKSIAYALDLYAESTCIPVFLLTISKISDVRDNTSALEGSRNCAKYDVSAMLLHTKFYDANNDLDEAMTRLVAWVNKSLHATNSFAIEIVQKIRTIDIENVAKFIE